MRSLIRPCLFAVARPGLFLAVAAWAVGQWWSTVVAIPLPGHTTRFLGGASGWHVSLVDGSGSFSGRMLRNEARENLREMSGSSAFALSVNHVDTSVFIYGTVSFPIAYSFVAISHWIIVFTLVAFNLLLHFIYRKRPEA